MKAFSLALLLMLALPGAAYAQSEEEAGDISEVDKDRLGPLRERIRPVSGHVFRKAGRFEISPGASLTFRDAFFSKYLLGASLTYHLNEEFAIGARAAYGLNTVAGAAQICTSSVQGDSIVRDCRKPTFEDLDGRAPGQIKLTGGLDLQWSPIYAKVALLSEWFLSFDLYLIAGASAIQYGGPGTIAADGTVSPSITQTTFGGNFGLGSRIFLNRWFTLRAEFRDLVYVEKVNSAENPNGLRNQLMFELGFSIFLPTSTDSE